MLHLLCHLDGKVLVGDGVVPRHVLANDGIEEELSDGGDLLQGRVIGQINGNASEDEVDHGDDCVQDEKGSSVFKESSVMFFLSAVYSGGEEGTFKYNRLVLKY